MTWNNPPVDKNDTAEPGIVPKTCWPVYKDSSSDQKEAWWKINKTIRVKLVKYFKH